MYVYVTKFEKYPNLIKIGMSIAPEVRTAGLAKLHGRILTNHIFFIGDRYSEAERTLHAKYAKHRMKDVVVGDGSTEFFSDSIHKAVCKDLKSFKTNGRFTKEHLQQELKIEEVRYKRLAGRLLGCHGSKNYTGLATEFPAGTWDFVRISQCLEVGFSREEVFSKFVENKLTPKYTTVGRVEIAYHLHLNGSRKSQKLEELLDEMK